MSKKIKIKDILQFMEVKKIKYTFKGDENIIVEGFSSLFNYKEKSMTFISTLYKFEDYKKEFKDKTIRLILMDPSEKEYENFENILIIPKPTNAFFSILKEFFSKDELIGQSAITNKEEQYKKHSYISKDTQIGTNVSIGRGCVIEADVKIGDNTTIHHNVVIRSGTKIGENCIIRSGTVIGEDGFSPSTLQDGTKEMLKHFGAVNIGDDVLIGENCIIHRGSIDDTIIKDGVKLNSLVHVAHNCHIGKNTVVTMPTHISGSVIIGNNCHIAASTIRNQCTIGNNVVLGLGSVVVKDVADNLVMVGNPARELKK